MRKIIRNIDHLYAVLKAYDKAERPLTWTEAFKRSIRKINQEEFQILSNLLVKANYLSGQALLKNRKRKYWREHETYQPADFTYYRSIEQKGNDFISSYESLNAHLNAVYPDHFETKPLPPEPVHFVITGKAKRAPNGELLLPVRIERLPPS